MSGNKTSSTPNPNPQSGSTVLSRASAHGRSQLKLQNLGVGVYTKCLNGTTISEQGPTPDVKLAAMGPNRLASSVHPCFVEASSTVEKDVSCYKADQLVASLLSFRSVQSSPAVREFRAAREERCEPSHGQVCANLMSWRPKHIRAMLAQRTYLQIHYARISMVGGYTENPEKPQNCQKWRVGACTGMGTCSGQYGIYSQPHILRFPCHMLVKRISTGEVMMWTDFVTTGKFPQWWRNPFISYSDFSVGCCIERKLSVTNLSSENNLSTF